MTDQTNRIDKIIAEHLGVEPEKVVPDALLVPIEGDQRDNLAADSLDIVELVMAFEDEFGVEIPDDESEKLNTGTVGDCHALIAAKTGQA